MRYTLSPREVSKGAKIRNRYNQVSHLTQDTNGKVTNSQQTPQTKAKRSAKKSSFVTPCNSKIQRHSGRSVNIGNVPLSHDICTNVTQLLSLSFNHLRFIAI